MPAKHSYPGSQKLTFCLQMIHNRQMALPDFQRDFVWDPAMTDELIESLINNFPAGTLLWVKNGKELLFRPRAVQDAPPLDGSSPAYLILDGQQRLTSLYQAFYGVGTHRFFLNLGSLEDGSLDLEDAAFFERSERASKSVGRIEEQADNLIFPMGRLFTNGGFEGWTTDVLRLRAKTSDDLIELSSRLGSLRTLWLKPVEDYEFPYVELDENTPGAAVCTIFETLNRTGVKLGVFDLLAARFWPKKVDLRDMWAKASSKHKLLGVFQIDPYYVLQVVNLLEPGVDKDGHPKAPSIKRGEILTQSYSQAQSAWDRAVDGLAQVLDILRDDCGVAAARWLPYNTMLIPAAAAWAAQSPVAKGAQVGANRAKLVRWFWCASIGQRFENAPNSQAAKDFVELRRWMTEPDAAPPETVQAFSFEASQLRTTTVRQRAVYRALMCLVIHNGAQDFHKRGRISTQLLNDSENWVDDHHIFPQGYLDPRGVPSVLRDSILNRTLIDKLTNIRIGKRAPSDYLSEIRGAWSSGPEFEQLLESHLLPTGEKSPLLADDFDAFLAWRESRLADAIAAATGMANVKQEGTTPEAAPAPLEAAAEDVSAIGGSAITPTIPPDVEILIQNRASAWSAPLARRFAEEALAMPGIELRVQNSKLDPWYFQVRHEGMKYAAAYAHPRQGELHIEFALPQDHAAPAIAIRRDNSYGIALKVRQSSELPVAMQLLREAVVPS